MTTSAHTRTPPHSILVSSPTSTTTFAPLRSTRPFFSRGNSCTSISTTETALDDVKSLHSPSSHSPRQSSSAHRGPRCSQSVRFSDEVLIIPNVGEPMSLAEMEAYFITADDVKRFEKDRLLTIHTYVRRRRAGVVATSSIVRGGAAGRGVAWNDNLYSIRGLEDFLDTERKQKLRSLHITTVLQEQERLRVPGLTGNAEFLLAEAAKRTSRESRQEALVNGRKDTYAGYGKNVSLLRKLKSLVE